MPVEDSERFSQVLSRRWWRSQAARVANVVQSLSRGYVPQIVVYQGSQGRTWIAGHEPRGPSIAAYFCGDDIRSTSKGRIWGGRVPKRIKKIADSGALPIMATSHPHPSLAEVLDCAITTPALVDMHIELPPDVETLRAQLHTSTTKEDFRRIRKANFTYRVSTDPDEVREFHARHYSPLVEQQFPEDGKVRSVGSMLRGLDEGAELVCAEIDGEWVAGIFNGLHGGQYALRNLGIRDADEEVRNKRVVAALVVRSLERAVELGYDTAKMGQGLPFLGKGPLWFKAKWGAIISHSPTTQDLHMFIDLGNASVRQMLSKHPIIHIEGDSLVASAWLEAGEKALQATVREAGRFPGISRWYVLGEPETLEAGAAELSESDLLVPVPVRATGDRPIWLSKAVTGALVPV